MVVDFFIDVDVDSINVVGLNALHSLVRVVPCIEESTVPGVTMRVFVNPKVECEHFVQA